MMLGNPDILPVHPWQTRAEILQVIQSVRTDNIAACKKAVDNLTLWEIRLGARFAEVHGVTKNVLINMIEYEEFGEISNLNSLALTLSRFVDVFTEKGKKEMAQEFTVLEMARQVDIPDWVVDIRHDIVHRALPPSCLLYKALIFCKQYLWTHFWSEVYIDVPLTNTEVREDFIKFLQSVIENKENNTKSLHPFIKKLSLEQYRILADVLSEYIYQLCTTEELCGEKCIRSYMPVFSDLSRYGLINQLLVQLVDRLVTQPDENQLIMKWIMAIIKKVRDQIDDETIIYMREQCVEHLGSSTIQLLTKLSEIPPDDQGLSSLVNINNKTELHKQTNITDIRLRTAEDLNMNIGEGECIITSHIQDGWYRDDGKDWRKIPLGFMFNFKQPAIESLDEQLYMTDCENEVTEPNQSNQASNTGNQSSERTKFSIRDFEVEMF